MNILRKNRDKIYDFLHLGAVTFCAVSALGLSGLIGYNLYLFRTVSVPFYENKYRDKLEKQIEYKQLEAELIEQQKAAERELLARKEGK